MNIFPYSNFHELNLDWIIDKIKENSENLTEFVKLNTIKYANPLQWDITKQYEANTIVIDDATGFAYLSTKPVPTGVALERTEYWVPVFNVYAIYEDIKTGVAYNNKKSDTSLFDLKKGSLVWVNDKMRQVTKDITMGDRFTDSNSVSCNVSDVLVSVINSLTTLDDSLTNFKTDTAGNFTQVNGKIDTNTSDIGELNTKVDHLTKMTSALNVVAYGAKGDGVTDDYPSFKACYEAAFEGATIVVPDGVYLLSKNPYPPADFVSSVTPISGKLVRWDIANGAYFIGAGAGDPNIGHGTFDSPFLTNPWLSISGPTQVYSLNGIPVVPNGALMADSKELDPIDTTKTYESNNWHCLEYRGACTGKNDNIKCNVELLNQVLNITGCKSIATEIDVNNYANPEGFSVGIFLTGNGAGGGAMTAVDIQRDVGSTKWVAGVSSRNCQLGFFADNATCDTGFAFGDVPRKAHAGLAILQAENGADGIVIRRNTDTNPAGNLFVIWDNKQENELFAIGVNGDIRTATPIVQTETYTKSGSFTAGQAVVFNITPPAGKKAIMVSEVHPVGFVTPVWYTSKTANTVTVFCSGAGTGSIEITVLYA